MREVVTARDVTVLIPTYNRYDRVLSAVQSALEQTAAPRRVLVVDDGSTDGTAEALAAIPGPVTVVRSEQNRGVSAARNLGLAHTETPWVALLDSDDTWRPEHLALLVGYLNQHPHRRAAQTRERWFRDGRRVNPRPIHVPSDGDMFEPSLSRCMVSSSAVVLWTETVRAVGGYDERLPACEDYDLWLRLARQRLAFGLVETETIEKDGGRPDQLSRKFWGMDRFRVFSLAKLLAAGLERRRADMACRVSLEKLAILRAGAERRENTTAVRCYDQWRLAIEQLASGAPRRFGPDFDADAVEEVLSAQLEAVGLDANRRDLDPIRSAFLPPNRPHTETQTLKAEQRGAHR